MAEYEIHKDNEIDDESSKDDFIKPFQYDITSFGIDYDVEGLVKRLNRGDIYIPHFQRNYIWNISDASKFVESLLLGLPVPGIFLAREEETNKLIVIDGQQRIKSLQFFYNGIFNPEANIKKKIFKLIKVQKEFEAKTYEDLQEKDRINLDDSIIHATIIKQENPKEDDNSSIYYIFERLNAGGRKLVPQEIRAVISYGKLLYLIEKLNKKVKWRKIFGKPHPRLKDRELILRFLTFYYNLDNYEKPMKDFLSLFLRKNRNPDKKFLLQCENIFDSCIEAVFKSIGEKAFRPEKLINAACFDSVMVGLANRLKSAKDINNIKLKESYTKLLKDSDYISAISTSTASKNSVLTRINKAVEAFKAI
ncbi:DUF262 domain-containing protein [Candidatus Magnetomoraceae bacterium gMMP-15]